MLNYRASKLLLHFIEYRLDQLNSQHTKIAVKSIIQYLKAALKRNESLKLFGPPTLKWWPCKIFAKLNRNHLLMANFFKLHEYQTFGLMEMHNMCKIWFDNNIFRQLVKKVDLWLTGRLKCYFLLCAISLNPNF